MSQEILTEKEVPAQPKGVAEDERELLMDYYVQKVSNRLRQLRSPGENDKKRWIWELLQNAKDSISNSEIDKVDIVLEQYEDRIVFLHNGRPFTPKALNSLIWQKSGEKRGSVESTGRFGTGFLTTHTLSQTVMVETVLKDTDGSLYGVEFTLNRDGETDDELKDGISKTLDSRKYINPASSEWTKFTYILKSKTNKESAEAGIESFLSNIYFNMAFAPEINSVKFVGLKNSFTIERIQPQKVNEEITIQRFKMSCESVESIVSVAMSSIEEANTDLTTKFKQQRDLRLSIAIQIDEERKEIIKLSDKVPQLYCVFPLIGTETFYFPIIINSPDFEPVPERDRLFLSGDKYNGENQEITIDGINKVLIERSSTLVSAFYKYFSENRYKNLHLLARGGKMLPDQERDFDESWYKNNIQSSLRKLITETPLVETVRGLMPFKNAEGQTEIIFPKAETRKARKSIYDFTRDIFPEKLPAETFIDEWADLIWKEDCEFQTAEKLVEQVSGFQNLSTIPLPEGTDKTDWINRLIAFADAEERELLEKYAIIPNQEDDFKQSSFEDFSIDENIPPEAIDILETFGINWKAILLKKGITSVSFQLKKNIAEFSIELNTILKKAIAEKSETLKSSVLNLTSYIPAFEKADTDFIKKREEIYKLTSDVFGGVVPIKKNCEFPDSVWELCDAWVLKELMRELSITGSLSKLFETYPSLNIVWFNSFIGFINANLGAEIFNNEEYKILPDQKGNFKIKSVLSKDESIPSELKTDDFEAIGLLLKDDLLDTRITNFTPEKGIDIAQVASKINDLLKNQAIEEDHRLRCSLKLIEILPSAKSPVLSTFQKSLLKIVQKFFNNQEFQAKEIDNFHENLWAGANEILIAHILNTIGQVKIKVADENQSVDQTAINQLESMLGLTTRKDTILWINELHDFLKLHSRDLGMTVPNQNGEFCMLEELFSDESIPEELKDILYLLEPKNDFRKILSMNGLTALPSHKQTTEDIAKEIDKIIKSDNKNRTDDDFKEAVNKLVIEWFNNAEYPLTVQANFKNGNSYTVNREYFQYCWSNREALEINLLWTVDERKDMQSLKKQLPKGTIKQLLEHPNIIEENRTLKEDNDILTKKVTDLTKIIDNPAIAALIASPEGLNVEVVEKAVQLINNYPDITEERLEKLLQLEELAKGWDTTVDHNFSDEQKRKNFENGWLGEAFVFNVMRKKNLDVYWPNKSEVDTTNIIIDHEGVSHFINDKGHKYDLIINLPEGNRAYIQVKSTTTDIQRADQIALPISAREWNFVNETSDTDGYYLARIFNVNSKPELYFMKLHNSESWKIS